MAEFKEVMRQAERMHNSANCECADCPIHAYIKASDFTGDCEDVARVMPDTFEAIVMAWASDHPEPVYPTWEEWQEQVFPNNGHIIHPCAFMEKSDTCLKDSGFTCAECRKQPIPAYIAEKLGIKPKGVRE